VDVSSFEDETCNGDGSIGKKKSVGSINDTEKRQVTGKWRLCTSARGKLENLVFRNTHTHTRTKIMSPHFVMHIFSVDILSSFLF
jgi:hypothetical protein